MRRFILFVGGMAWALTVAPITSVAKGDTVRMRIVGKSSEALAAEQGRTQSQIRHTLVLRNDASQIVTAWRFSCLYAENDGNFAVASVEQDAYFQYHRGTPADADGSGPVEPGEVREVVVPGLKATGPYEALSCAVDAVVFADGSSSGVASHVDRIFEDRARTATDALVAIDALDRIEAGQQVLEGALAPDNRYVEEVGAVYRDAEAGSLAPLLELRARLHEHVEIVGKHLPEAWRERHAISTTEREGVR